MSSASLGKMALRSIIDAGDRTIFRSLRESLFDEDEVPLFQFLKSHLSTHRKLPNAVTVKAHGFDLPKVHEPPVYYAHRLYERKTFEVITRHQAALSKAMTSGDSKQCMQVMRAQLREATAIKNPNSYSTLVEVGKEVMADMQVMKWQAGLPGITTGWSAMDQQTLGLCPGDMFTFAGRPGQGKTWRLLWMARAAWRAGNSILICSNEMLNKAIVRRFMGIDTGINPRGIRSGRLQHWTENKLVEAIHDYKDMPDCFLVSGKFDRTVGGIAELIEVLDPDVVYLDAAYLFKKVNARRNASLSDDVSEVMTEIKSTLRDSAKPGVITVQFNRTVQTNAFTGKRNKAESTHLDLNQLSRTDTIGQDSDAVWGIKHAPAPFEKTRSINVPLKIREGDGNSFEFAIHTKTAPMDFSEVTAEELASQEGEDDGETAESIMEDMI